MTEHEQMIDRRVKADRRAAQRLWYRDRRKHIDACVRELAALRAQRQAGSAESSHSD